MLAPLTKLIAALALSLASGLRLSPAVTAASPRSRHIVMEAAECAMIDLSTDDPVRVANTLKKAWMEGAVKRGLVGSVLVPSDNVVTIVAMGPRSRLNSFAEWVETSSQLVSKVTMSDACPVDDAQLDNKFTIAESDASSPWLDELNKATIDVRAFRWRPQTLREASITPSLSRAFALYACLTDPSARLPRSQVKDSAGKTHSSDEGLA